MTYSSPIVFIPNTDKLAVIDGGRIHIWNAMTGNYQLELKNTFSKEELQKLGEDGVGRQEAYELLRVCRNGKFLLGADRYNHRVTIWSTDNWEVVATIRSGYEDLQFNYDGSKLVISAVDHFDIWETKTGKKIITLEGSTFNCKQTEFSLNGKYVAASCFDSYRLWNPENGQLLEKERWHDKSTINQVLFSPDSKTIVSTSNDGEVVFIETANGRVKHRMKVSKYYVRDAMFLDGSRLLIIFDEGAVVYDAATYNPLYALPKELSNPCVYNRKRNLLAGDFGLGRVKVFDASNGKPLFDFKLESERDITVCDFNTNGTRLVAESRDGNMALWNLETGNCLNELKN